MWRVKPEMEAAELEQLSYTAETLMCSFKWQRLPFVTYINILHPLICMLTCAVSFMLADLLYTNVSF